MHSLPLRLQQVEDAVTIVNNCYGELILFAWFRDQLGLYIRSVARFFTGGWIWKYQPSDWSVNSLDLVSVRHGISPCNLDRYMVNRRRP